MPTIILRRLNKTPISVKNNIHTLFNNLEPFISGIIVFCHKISVPHGLQLIIGDFKIALIMSAAVQIAQVFLHIFVYDTKPVRRGYDVKIPSFPAKLVFLALVKKILLNRFKNSSAVSS